MDSRPTVNPFDQMLRHAAGLRSRPRMASPIRDVAASKTAVLLGFLADGGPASTRTLCSVAGLETRLVWGLLKAPRERGQISFADGMWSVVTSYDDDALAQLRAAAALLRRNGWTVCPPQRS